MKNIDKFAISVPELGDRPNIDVVSKAIGDIGDAFSGSIEMATAVRSGARLTLSSSRNVKRTNLYDGLTIQFVSNFNAFVGAITEVSIDNLSVQPVTFANDVVVGEFCLLQYKGSGFTCTVVSGKLPDDVMRTGGIEVTGKSLEDKKADRDELYLASAPIGSMHLYPSHIIPVGWLLCDGRTITEEDYPELFKLIGNKLPDMRGQFARGLDNGKGIDSGREMGSYQGDAIRNITGSFDLRGSNVFNTPNRTETIFNESGAFYSDENYQTADSQGIQANQNTFWRERTIFDASRQVPTAPENRPKNVAYNYIIKASYLTSVPVAVDVANDLNSKIETNYNNHQEAIINNDGQSVGWNGVTYIQDVGEKVAGKLYYDRLQSGLWYCKANNTSVVNDSNFINHSNVGVGERVRLGVMRVRNNISISGSPGASFPVPTLASKSDNELVYVFCPNTTPTLEGNTSNMATICTIGQLKQGITLHLKRENPDSQGEGCFFIWKLVGGNIKNVTSIGRSSFTGVTVVHISDIYYQ